MTEKNVWLPWAILFCFKFFKKGDTGDSRMVPSTVSAGTVSVVIGTVSLLFKSWSLAFRSWRWLSWSSVGLLVVVTSICCLAVPVRRPLIRSLVISSGVASGLTRLRNFHIARQRRTRASARMTFCCAVGLLLFASMREPESLRQCSSLLYPHDRLRTDTRRCVFVWRRTRPISLLAKLTGRQCTSLTSHLLRPLVAPHCPTSHC